MSSNTPPLLDKEGLYAYVFRRLGAPQRNVELLREAMDELFNDSMAWFSAWKGVRKQIIAPINANNNKYNLFDIAPDIDTVITVDFQNNNYTLSNLYSFGMFDTVGFPAGLIGYGSGGFGGGASAAVGGIASSYVQSLQYIEQLTRIFSGDGDFSQENNIPQCGFWGRHTCSDS